MKRCPSCNKTFTDQNLSFCIDDGTPLAPVTAAEDETTVVTPSSSPGSSDSADSKAYVPRDWQTDYQPPGSLPPPVQKRKVWPWVVGILAVFIIGLSVLALAAAILVPNMMRAASNRNSSNHNLEQSSDANSNLNSATPDANSDIEQGNGNTNTGKDETVSGSAPADEDKVLAELTELEHEWTVANIEADRQKLAQILADDYVGTSSDGKSQGKAEYLRTIEPDASIERWDFEDLKVDLKGDRVSLTGVIRLRIRNQDVAYRFTDKFVWRDGRWQAVSSEVAPLKLTEVSSRE